VIFKKAKIGRNNLNVVKDSPSSRFLGDGEVIEFNPGTKKEKQKLKIFDHIIIILL
jgi:hypothetical protein